MKMRINLILILFVFVQAAWAQRGGPYKEKVDALKVGFITKKLDLTAGEAQKFWPVYNKYHELLEKNRSGMKEILGEQLGNLDKMTSAEADKALLEMQAMRSQELEVLKLYTLEFKKILPTQKVVKLFIAEQEFKRELLRQLKEQRRR
jgi:hypothetical protein